MRRTVRTILITAAVSLALWAELPRQAFACHASDHSSQVVTCFSGLNVAIAGAVFIVPEIYYAARKSWLPPRWAWAHVFVGSAVGVSGIVSIALAPSVRALDDGHTDHSHGGIEAKPGFLAASGGLILATGAWFVIHGALSLARYRPPGVSSTAGRPAGAPHLLGAIPSIVVLPSVSGAHATATWRF